MLCFDVKRDEILEIERLIKHDFTYGTNVQSQIVSKSLRLYSSQINFIVCKTQTSYIAMCQAR